MVVMLLMLRSLHAVKTHWLWLLALLCVVGRASQPLLAATRVTIAVVSLEGDPRHALRRLEKAYPGHPSGRAIDGVKLAAQDSAFELDAAGITFGVVGTLGDIDDDVYYNRKSVSAEEIDLDAMSDLLERADMAD